MQYYLIYQSFGNASIVDVLDNKDVLFYIFFFILNKVFQGDFSLALIVINGVTLYMVVCALEAWRERVSLPLGLFVYYAYFALIAEDQMRQMFALSLFLLAIRYAFSQNPIKYFALIIVGGLCHVTVFLGLPLYWFVRDISRKNEVLILAIVLASLFACFMSETVFSVLGRLFGDSRYSNYFGNESIAQTEEGIGSGLGFLIYLAPCALPLVFYYKYLSQREFWFFFLLIALAAPLKMLSYESTFLGRLYLIPAISIVVMYPLIYNAIPSKRKQTAFLVASCTLLSVFFLYSFSTSHGVATYSFFSG